jgi:uncharacterized protein (TIGR00156 family)
MTMHKRLLACGLSVLAFSVPAAGQFTGPGQGAVTTVADAHNARDDVPFDLTGNIIERLNDEYYTFRDATGTITAEIESNRFQGVQVAPETQVRIKGEIDRPLRGRELDVDRLEIVD